MSTGTVLWLLLSILIAGAIAYFQYFHKSVSKSRIRPVLAALRFLGCLALLVLLINPIITRSSFEVQKTPLVVLLDNSASIKELKADQAAKDVLEAFRKSNLDERFAPAFFKFDQDLNPIDSLAFDGRHSNHDAAARGLEEIYRSSRFPTILLTDGNQTRGSDYTYSFSRGPVFPVILGDTVQHPDLRIERINVNKYAFLNNQFPAEVFLRYSGNRPVSAQFTISQEGEVITRQSVTLSPEQSAKTLQVLLPAKKSGVCQFVANLSGNLQEKNTYNNSKRFAVEVMDQKSGIALVSAIAHPDLGAIRRSIETNAQRQVTLVRPYELKDLSPYNVLIYYQPVAAFKPVFELNKQARLNTLTITGMATDFEFLNREQSVLAFRNSGQPEDYQAVHQADFTVFAQDDIGFGKLPPLEHPFGAVTVKQPVNTLLTATIRNIPADAPLLTFTETGSRQAFLLGENIWKWRMHLHAQSDSFDEFDRFLDKTIQFLATSGVKKSLVVNHERFYNSGDAIEITAQYFNKNYEFDHTARLTATVVNKANRQSRTYDMLKGQNSFKANLDGLPAGTYQLTVRERQSNAVYNAQFEVLEFDIEKQFVNADTQKLKQLAETTDGQTYTPNQVESLIKKLAADEAYAPVQKKVTTKSPLIDWIWLLVVIAAAFSCEWFIRKYHGML